MAGRLQRELHQSRPFPSARIEAFLNLIRTADLLARPGEDLLRSEGLSSTSYNVLRILAGAGDTGLSCGDIAGRLVTRDPDVTRLVDRLEARGLALRGRSSQDRRVVLVRVTPEGRELLRRLDLDRRIGQLHAPFFDQLSAPEIDQLITLLEALRGPESSDAAPTTA